MYLVWQDNYTDGWSKSEELEDLDQVYAYLLSDLCMSHRTIITETVPVKLIKDYGNG